MTDSMIKRVSDAIYNAASGPECSGISDALAQKMARAAIDAMPIAVLAALLWEVRASGPINPYNEHADLAKRIDAALTEDV